MNQLIRLVEETIRRHDKTTQQFAHDIGISSGYLYNFLKGRQKAGTKFFKAFSNYTDLTIDTLVALQDASLDDPPVEKFYDVDLREDQLIALEWWHSLTDEERERIRAKYGRKRDTQNPDE